MNPGFDLLPFIIVLVWIPITSINCVTKVHLVGLSFISWFSLISPQLLKMAPLHHPRFKLNCTLSYLEGVFLSVSYTAIGLPFTFVLLCNIHLYMVWYIIHRTTLCEMCNRHRGSACNSWSTCNSWSALVCRRYLWNAADKSQMPKYQLQNNTNQADRDDDDRFWIRKQNRTRFDDFKTMLPLLGLRIVHR